MGRLVSDMAAAPNQCACHSLSGGAPALPYSPWLPSTENRRVRRRQDAGAVCSAAIQSYWYCQGRTAAATPCCAAARRSAGITAHNEAETEVIVVGGGAAGLTAAYFAASQGAQVCASCPRSMLRLLQHIRHISRLPPSNILRQAISSDNIQKSERSI